MISFVESLLRLGRAKSDDLSEAQDIVSFAKNSVGCVQDASSTQLEISDQLINETLELDEDVLNAPVRGIKMGYLYLQTRSLGKIAYTAYLKSLYWCSVAIFCERNVWAHFVIFNVKKEFCKLNNDFQIGIEIIIEIST